MSRRAGRPGRRTHVRSTQTSNRPAQCAGRFSLALGGAGVELSERIDPGEEGTIDAPSAIHLAGYTGGDPDSAPIGPDEARCYTNPVWAVPVDVSVQVRTAADQIPAGDLVATLDFPISMDPGAYQVEIQELDDGGEYSAVEVQQVFQVLKHF